MSITGRKSRTSLYIKIGERQNETKRTRTTGKALSRYKILGFSTRFQGEWTFGKL